MCKNVCQMCSLQPSSLPRSEHVEANSVDLSRWNVYEVIDVDERGVDGRLVELRQRANVNGHSVHSVWRK